jgi:hypothetical protein
MKTCLRVLGMASLLVAFVSLTGQEGKTTQSVTQLGADKLVVIIDPPDVKNWEGGIQYVNDYVGDLQARLGKLVLPGPLTHAMVPYIVAVYGDNGNFTGHDGVTYRGVREISVYLDTLIGCHKITNFKIELKVVYAKQIPPALRIDRGDDTVLHNIYFIYSCSFLLDGRLIDPLGSTNCTHVKVCECDRGK